MPLRARNEKYKGFILRLLIIAIYSTKTAKSAGCEKETNDTLGFGCVCRPA